MNRRRLGCMIFGLCSAAVMLITIFGLSLGHPVDSESINPLRVAFWVEIAIFVAGAALFYRAEMKGGEY